MAPQELSCWRKRVGLQESLQTPLWPRAGRGGAVLEGPHFLRTHPIKPTRCWGNASPCSMRKKHSAHLLLFTHGCLWYGHCCAGSCHLLEGATALLASSQRPPTAATLQRPARGRSSSEPWQHRRGKWHLPDRQAPGWEGSSRPASPVSIHHWPLTAKGLCSTRHCSWNGPPALEGVLQSPEQPPLRAACPPAVHAVLGEIPLLHTFPLTTGVEEEPTNTCNTTGQTEQA